MFLTEACGGHPVEVDYDQPHLRLDLTPGGTAGDYDGLDRFGRVKDLLCRDYGTPGADAVRIGHGYEYAGNRTYREDVVAARHNANWDEAYGYDGLHQLTDQDFGALNTAQTAIDGTSLEIDHSLDALGNRAGLTWK